MRTRPLSRLLAAALLLLALLALAGAPTATATAMAEGDPAAEGDASQEPSPDAAAVAQEQTQDAAAPAAAADAAAAAAAPAAAAPAAAPAAPAPAVPPSWAPLPADPLPLLPPLPPLHPPGVDLLALEARKLAASAARLPDPRLALRPLPTPPAVNTDGAYIAPDGRVSWNGTNWLATAVLADGRRVVVNGTVVRPAGLTQGQAIVLHNARVVLLTPLPPVFVTRSVEGRVVKARLPPGWIEAPAAAGSAAPGAVPAVQREAHTPGRNIVLWRGRAWLMPDVAEFMPPPHEAPSTHARVWRLVLQPNGRDVRVERASVRRPNLAQFQPKPAPANKTKEAGAVATPAAAGAAAPAADAAAAPAAAAPAAGATAAATAAASGQRVRFAKHPAQIAYEQESRRLAAKERREKLRKARARAKWAAGRSLDKPITGAFGFKGVFGNETDAVMQNGRLVAAGLPIPTTLAPVTVNTVQVAAQPAAAPAAAPAAEPAAAAAAAAAAESVPQPDAVADMPAASSAEITAEVKEFNSDSAAAGEKASMEEAEAAVEDAPAAIELQAATEADAEDAADAELEAELEADADALTDMEALMELDAETDAETETETEQTPAPQPAAPTGEGCSSFAETEAEVESESESGDALLEVSEGESLTPYQLALIRSANNRYLGPQSPLPPAPTPLPRPRTERPHLLADGRISVNHTVFHVARVLDDGLRAVVNGTILRLPIRSDRRAVLIDRRLFVAKPLPTTYVQRMVDGRMVRVPLPPGWRLTADDTLVPAQPRPGTSVVMMDGRAWVLPYVAGVTAPKDAQKLAPQPVAVPVARKPLPALPPLREGATEWERKRWLRVRAALDKQEELNRDTHAVMHPVLPTLEEQDDGSFKLVVGPPMGLAAPLQAMHEAAERVVDLSGLPNVTPATAVAAAAPTTRARAAHQHQWSPALISVSDHVMVKPAQRMRRLKQQLEVVLH